MKKKYRIKRNEDFSKIIKQKRSWANSYFIIYTKENDLGHIRVGISVSKKIGNAVTRNKIKRQVRMIINQKFKFNISRDYIIIIRDNYLKNSYQDNFNSLMNLYYKVRRMDN